MYLTCSESVRIVLPSHPTRRDVRSVKMSRFFFWIGCASFFAFFIGVLLTSSLISTFLVDPTLVDPAYSELTEAELLQEAEHIAEESFIVMEWFGLGFWGGCVCWLIALIAKAFNR